MNCVQKSIRGRLKLRLASQDNAKGRWPSNDRGTSASNAEFVAYLSNTSSFGTYCLPGSSPIEEAEANFQSDKKIVKTSKFQHTSSKATIHNDLESFMHLQKKPETVPCYVRQGPRATSSSSSYEVEHLLKLLNLIRSDNATCEAYYQDTWYHKSIAERYRRTLPFLNAEVFCVFVFQFESHTTDARRTISF